jgi:hypothetical protein
VTMARHNPPIKALQIFRPRWLRASIAERAEYASNLVSQSREFFSRELTRESVGRDARCFCLGFRLVESLVHTVVGFSAYRRAARGEGRAPRWGFGNVFGRDGPGAASLCPWL